jgi:hypothetical protein
MGKIPGSRQASAKEVRELMKLPWVHDESLSLRGMEARVLPDGRVLLFIAEGSKAPLYPSREAVREVLRRGQGMLAKPPLGPATLLPPVDEFLRDVEAHAKALGKVIRVPAEALDMSDATLDVIYKAVLKVRRQKRETPEVFTPLTAYVGEVMRRICDGRWAKFPATWVRDVPVYDPEQLSAWQALAQASQVPGKAPAGELTALHPRPIRVDKVEEPTMGQDINEPVIYSRDGRMFQPFAIILDQLMEYGNRGSLLGAVQGTLLRYLTARDTGAPAAE